MKNLSCFNNAILIAAVAVLLGQVGFASAHTEGAVMDPAGNKASFTALALVTCFNDGGGDADHIIARVRDNSPAVPGLLVSLQILKGGRAINVTDATSGDADFSNFVALHGGGGGYQLMANKTAIGARDFEVEFHCNAADGTHTGTNTFVQQFD